MHQPLLRKLHLGGIICRFCVIHLGSFLNYLNPHKQRDFARSTRWFRVKILILTLNIRSHCVIKRFCLCLLIYIVFLQIQNKNNDDIVLLAPPRPWQRRKCFAAEVATAVCLNGPRPVVNGKRTNGEWDSSSCTLFAAPLMMNCIICRCASALLPLAEAKARCSGGPHCHSS